MGIGSVLLFFFVRGLWFIVCWFCCCWEVVCCWLLKFLLLMLFCFNWMLFLVSCVCSIGSVVFRVVCMCWCGEIIWICVWLLFILREICILFKFCGCRCNFVFCCFWWVNSEICWFNDCCYLWEFSGVFNIGVVMVGSGCVWCEVISGLVVVVIGEGVLMIFVLFWVFVISGVNGWVGVLGVLLGCVVVSCVEVSFVKSVGFFVGNMVDGILVILGVLLKFGNIVKRVFRFVVMFLFRLFVFLFFVVLLLVIVVIVIVWVVVNGVDVDCLLLMIGGVLFIGISKFVCCVLVRILLISGLFFVVGLFVVISNWGVVLLVVVLFVNVLFNNVRKFCVVLLVLLSGNVVVLMLVVIKGVKWII